MAADLDAGIFAGGNVDEDAFVQMAPVEALFGSLRRADVEALIPGRCQRREEEEGEEEEEEEEAVDGMRK